MGIKTYNPYTPSRRNMTGSDFAEITTSTPEKSLCESLKKNAGRNNQGKITVRHQGGGNRRKYRIIDFKRNAKDGIPAVVKTIEYDPNRTANIALICYEDGEKAYILAPEGLKVGQKVMNGPQAEVRVGKNESLDTALKRFKRSCAKDGVIAEVRKREHYEKPSVKRKKKSEAARKRKY